MPIPVFFKVGDREVSVTHDEAREIATSLPAAAALLRSTITTRLDEAASGLIDLDADVEAEVSLTALVEAIDSIEGEHDLSPAMKGLRSRAGDALENLNRRPHGLRLADEP
jgi:hypothetical protein